MGVGQPGAELERKHDPQSQYVQHPAIQPPLAEWARILRTVLLASVLMLWIRLRSILSLSREPIHMDSPLLLPKECGSEGSVEHVEQGSDDGVVVDVIHSTVEEIHESDDAHPEVDTVPRESPDYGLSENPPPPPVAVNSIVIKRIQAAGVTAGLRRTPVGFYILIQFAELEWRTSNQPVMVDDDMLQWDDVIVLPPDLSASVRLEIRATYELAPMLGSGHVLGATYITVGGLLNHSTQGLSIAFFPRDEEPFSPSFLVTAERCECERTDLAVILPHRPPDSDRLRRLEESTDLGHNALSHYRKQGRNKDLEQALGQHQRALNICPPEHPRRAAALCNLGSAKLVSYRVHNSYFDLEDSISLYRDALELRPLGHPDRPATLCQLATALLVQSQNHHSEINLVQGEELLRQVLELSPHESFEHRSAFLMLETQRVWNAVRSSDGEPLVWTWAYFIQGFVECEPAELGAQLVHRFQRCHDMTNLHLGISLLEARKRSVSRWDHRYPGILCNLGAAFLHRFKRFGELDDLDQAIARFEDALLFAPRDHLDRGACLSNLGVCFRTRFDRLGDLGDLDQAITKQEEAASLTPEDHPDRAGRLNGLGVSFNTRFGRLGELGDLDRAIASSEEAAQLTPEGHPDHASRLNNLGVLYRTRFQQLGNLDNLDRATALHENAVRLTPSDLSERPVRLNNAGITFKTRFDRFGHLPDLDHAIASHAEAIQLTPNGHPDRPGRLNSFAVSLKARFDRLGEVGDLDQAISMQECALQLVPNDHPDRAGHLDVLGISCRTRFQRLHELRDLDRAILTQKEAVQLTPDGHPDRVSRLNNLVITLRTRFDLHGDMGDLYQAISLQQYDVELTQGSHPDRASRLNNLGVLYNIRFQRLDVLADLEHAIAMLEHAIQLIPYEHRERPGLLNNIGITLRVRFDRLMDRQDLDRAITYQEDAVRLTPHDHPSLVAYLLNLGISFLARSHSLCDNFAMENALSTFSVAARSTGGPSSLRFSAVQKWISCARSSGHSSLLDAYSVALQIIPQLAWIGLPLQIRYRELIRAADITREAVSAALEQGQAEKAVEWLEQGRSVVWSELLQLRAPVDELRAEHPELAERLLRVSNALEQASARDQPMALDPSLEEQACRHRALALEREELLREIRSLHGFEGFLLGKSFAQLRASAHTGPVVNLNASDRGCDALIVLAHVDRVLHVPLPNITISAAKDMVQILDQLLPGGRGPEPRGLKRPKVVKDDGDFQKILATLWTEVVRPVLDALGFSTPGELRRIFWCPTSPFSFLPLHAAGLYDTEKPGSKLSDFVISSYTPSLSALILAPKPNTTRNIRLLAVRQPDSDGQMRLPGAHMEMELIKMQGQPFSHVNLVESTATVDDVLEKMRDSEWVHFACHGVQDLANPLDSGLMLADGRRLTLADIMKLSRPHCGLAFLSACQTATGDGKLSEEALHLAAGMLFAGYGSVIATMWSIVDHEAPVIAKDVYGQLFKDAEAPDSTQSARALHYAVQRFREGGASFTSWAAIIHMGL